MCMYIYTCIYISLKEYIHMHIYVSVQDVASDMIISKAVFFLKHNNSKQAKATLEYFEKNDGRHMEATADATTLRWGVVYTYM